jgi:PAT family beta-lactamase induction signal transducer AmpG
VNALPDAAPVASPPLSKERNPALWVPSLYFAQGIPYVVVMSVAVVMLKRMGVSNAAVALYTSWLYLPWVVKPLWSPLVQGLGTRRGWTVLTQLLAAGGLAAAALAIPTHDFVRWTLAALAFVALSSATHDVAADGFYMLALSGHQQAWWVGVRSTAYRMAMIAGQGLLVMLAGRFESANGLPTVAIEVRAVDEEPAAITFDPQAAAPPALDALQRIVPGRETLALSLRGRSTSEANAVIDRVRKWNVDHGFYSAPQAAAAGGGKGDAADRAWTARLEDWIRRTFGPARTEAPATARATVGDAAVLQMRLSHPVETGRQQIVQFGLSSGDASFQVVEGERFVVTSGNWDQPFAAVVQTDAKLRMPSQAIFEIRSGNIPRAWSATFLILAGSFLVLCAYHYVVLPRPAADAPPSAAVGPRRGLKELLVPFATFLRKPGIVGILAYLLLYRFAEAQLTKLAQPFLLDARDAGGLALTTGQVGFVYGTVGVIMLTVGGLVGGFTAARFGLKRVMWPMTLAIHLPNVAFVYLAFARPESLWLISSAVGVEQFGYGFGFTAYLLFALYISQGKHQTVHYALCTGLMALGVMVPGMWSGWLQELVGYQHFFVWIMLATIPSFVAVALVRVDDRFGIGGDAS